MRKQHIFIDENVSFRNTRFGGYNRILSNSQVNNSSFGICSYLGWNSILNNVEIGAFCSIAPFVEVIYGRHPLNFVSTHPIFYSARGQCGYSILKENKIEEFSYVKDTKKSLIIKNDVWIGYGVKILEGLIVENGAVILAGSLVIEDVKPYSIVGGVPAKHIKYRFDDKVKDKLLQSQWWNNDIEWIKENLDTFLEPNVFANIQKGK